jgi:hypothetical protein
MEGRKPFQPLTKARCLLDSRIEMIFARGRAQATFLAPFPPRNAISPRTPSTRRRCLAPRPFALTCLRRAYNNLA